MAAQPARVSTADPSAVAVDRQEALRLATAGSAPARLPAGVGRSVGGAVA